ncbi:MAG: FAD-dependent oxidoreductase, partial [Rhodospirillaceae bacterium]|nr:FAD-dependent oxidoreductase [Rhodospirillaceae bacterium]
MTPTDPITCDIVLVGGGHSHVAVLKRFGMKPEPGVRLTLITRDLLTPYSGMVPGYIADNYSEAEAHIDLRPLAAFANARVIHAAATGLDLERNFVQVGGRPPVAFDFVSIDTGSTPSTANIDGAEHGLPVKPIDRFLEAYHRLTNEIRGHDGPFHIAVAGGGAGGVELTLALSHRLRSAAPSLDKAPADIRFAIVESEDTLLPGYNAAARRKLTRALSDRGIDVHTGAKAERITPDTLALSNGEALTSHKTILVTSAGPPRWITD